MKIVDEFKNENGVEEYPISVNEGLDDSHPGNVTA